MARTNKKLSKKAVSKSALRYNACLQWCWNYEKMQGAGYAYAMVPAFKELYDDNDEICRNLERHMQFYNTNPFSGAVQFGASLALEEGYQTEIADSLKVALMGPLAAIGDTIQAILLNPPMNILAASLAAEGNWLAVLIAILPSFLTFVVRWPLFYYGYRKGEEVIADVAGTSTFDTLQVAASILGITVIGGFIPSILASLKVAAIEAGTIVNEAGEEVANMIEIQSTLDAILPYMIPVVLTGLCYLLIKKYRVSPLKTILLVAVLTFVLGALGILVKG